MGPSEPLWAISNPSGFLVASSDTYRDPPEVKMSSTIEVKGESEAKLSEASANEKFLYSRVLELEKRNQKLKKKVKKLKKLKKKKKEQVLKLRGAFPIQHIPNGHDASTSDVEFVEELTFGPRQSNLDEEQAVNSDVNSNNVDKETASQSNGGAQVEDNSWLTIEDAAEEMEADNSEKLDKEALDNPSGTGSSEVSNQCPQCRKGFSSPGNLSLHIKGVHGPKKECSYCHKMINSVYINRHIREAHMGDTRMQEADRVVQVLRAHAGGPLRIQGKVPSMWKRNISQQVGTTHQRSSR